MHPINLKDKFARFSEQWSPKNVARLNDYHVKVVKLQGEFVWHSHEETDELFLVHRGEMVILLRDGEVRLGPGELFVVPQGVEHCPMAEEECEVLLIEPAGTVNTGDAGGERTAPHDVWI
jgi:mannose-6-phosphate isomerase-like protein (cupin superfamily)